MRDYFLGCCSCLLCTFLFIVPDQIWNILWLSYMKSVASMSCLRWILEDTAFINNPFVVFLCVQNHSSYAHSWGQQQVPCHLHHPLHTGGFHSLLVPFTTFSNSFLLFYLYVLCYDLILSRGCAHKSIKLALRNGRSNAKNDQHSSYVVLLNFESLSLLCDQLWAFFNEN